MATSVVTGYSPIIYEGQIAVGAKVFVLEPGTTTPKAIYSDQGLTTPRTNPMQTDADGFHPQAYLSGAYKIRIETGGTDTLGSGTLVRQWDNIDGGVPVGSGDLPIADGGTAASTAAAARTNLGVPSQTELNSLSTQLATLAGAVGSTGATQLATGTTAQRPADLAEGQLRRNTDTDRFEGYNGSGWENILTSTEIATQAEMETGTDLTKVVTPGRVKNSPGVAKAWAKFTVAGVVEAGHNVTSVTDNGTGNWTLNWTTAFSSANYAATIELFGTSSTRVLSKAVTAMATGTMTVQTFQQSDGTASETGITSILVTAFGDQ